MNNQMPIFYSFRRCPYAMRARLALSLSQQKVYLREIILRNKPEHMIKISPKATVPVLELTDGTVIDESLDIAKWALGNNDPNDILSRRDDDLIAQNDEAFKPHLDRYKYGSRYDANEALEHRDAACEFLNHLDQRLQEQKFLSGDQLGFSDIMIAPFIRQFAHVDRDWFFDQEWHALKTWLTNFIESELFLSIMRKYKPWLETGQDIIFPE